MLCCSAPFQLKHNLHVDFNEETGFSGLPPEWDALLLTSGISAADCGEDGMVECAMLLNFFEDKSFNNNNDNNSTVSKPPEPHVDTTELFEEEKQQDDKGNDEKPKRESEKVESKKELLEEG